MLRGRRLLDVGCGVGGFVEAAVADGWSAEGIDLAEAAIEIGRSHDLPVSAQDFFSDVFESDSRDMITMFEFIEHVPDPASFLHRAEELLKPGGLLYITTPNFNSVDRLIMGNSWAVVHQEHLSYFTPGSLSSMIARTTDLEILEVHARNISADTLRLLMGRKRSGPAVENPRTNDLREQIESSTVLRRLKATVNIVLDSVKVGSAMTMTLRKRNLAKPGTYVQ